MRVRSNEAGSERRSQRSFVTVNEATGTTPTSRAQRSAPPNSSMRSVASCAERVSFQSRAGRTISSDSSSVTMPCCCPPTAIAETPSSSPSAVADS